MWSKLPVDRAELSLPTVLRCGQSFRWRCSAGVWSICMQNRVLLLKQTDTHVLFRSEGPGSAVSDADLVRDYFNLDIDVASLYKQWAARDKRFAAKHTGVRILRQDPWETLCAFICSSNNNIKRISKMVEALCTEFGPRVAEIDGTVYHDFPPPQRLATEPAAVEARLRELGFGYRAKYIVQTAVLMGTRPATFLHTLRTAPAPEAVIELQKFSGVGPKVADCVALMSLDKHDIVPVDTHMYQIAARDYKLKVTAGPKGYAAVQTKLREIWGEYAGWAHSVLFAGDLRDLDGLAASNARVVPAKSEGEDKSRAQDELAGEAALVVKAELEVELEVKTELELKTEPRVKTERRAKAEAGPARKTRGVRSSDIRTTGEPKRARTESDVGASTVKASTDIKTEITGVA